MKVKRYRRACPAVIHFTVKDKAVFFVEAEYAFVVFDIGIYGQEAAGGIIGVTFKGKAFGGINHVRANSFVCFAE